PRVDVLFGGPVETFAAGIKEGIFEPYKSPSFAKLPARFKQADGQWTAIADDPLVFMTNAAFLKANNLKPPASWDDLLNPAYKNMLQMADARTSGTAVTRIFSVLEVNKRDEEKAFAYLKKLRQNVQVYTKSGGGGTLPVGLGQAGGGIFFIVDARIVLLGDHAGQRLARGEADEIHLDAGRLLELLEHRPGVVLGPDRVDVQRVRRLRGQGAGQPCQQAGSGKAKHLHLFPPMSLVFLRRP
ncbi:MAG: extracellular solute-binding protein, partial [Alphaproteobacteria bacterium]